MSGSGDKFKPRRPAPPPSKKRPCPSCACDGVAAKVQRPPPSPIILPPKEDAGSYRYVELSNSLRVLLISNVGQDGSPPDPYWTQKFPSAHCHEDANFMGTENECDPKVFEIVEEGPALLAQNFLGRHSEDATPFVEKMEQIENQKIRSLDACAPGTEISRPSFGLTISVNCGSHSDPANFQGLAHLVEHLVHYGCMNFPDDSSFVKFIQTHAGMYNAFTGSSYTNYHCAIRNSGIEVIREACNRYAQMLSHPLFNSELVLRELEAVDTEFYMRRSNQFIQALHLIPQTTINGSHPMKQFDCGSKEYLLRQGVAVEVATDELKAACHAFINQHYTGANMTLVLQGPETLDNLHTIVTASFGKIPVGTKLGRDVAASPPYDMTRFNSLFTIKPARSNNHELFIQWALPASAANNYDTKAAQFVAKCIRNQQPRGLAHHLKTQGWIVDLDVLVHGNRFSTDLYFYVELTQSGRDSIKLVIQTLFSFLKVLKSKGLTESDFQEVQRVDDFRFNNMELDRSLWGLIRLSIGIHKYRVEDIAIGGTFVRSRFDRRAITAVVNELVPNRANFILFTWNVDCGPDFSVDPLYGTQFLNEELPGNLANFFSSGMGNKNNPFPANLPENAIVTAGPPHPPSVLPGTLYEFQFRETITVSSYYMPSILTTPQGVYILGMKSSLGAVLLKEKDVLLTTWLTMLNLELMPSFAHQTALGTSVFVNAHRGKLLFLYRGFTAGLREATTAFIEALQAPLREGTFLAVKETVRNMYFHKAANSFTLAWDFFLKLKERKHETLAEKFEKADALILETLQTFVDQYKSGLHFTTIAEGYIDNGLEMCLAQLVAQIPTNLATVSIPPSFEPNKIKRVKEGTRCLRLKSLLDSEKVFAVMNYYEVGGRVSMENIIMTYVIYLGLRNIVFNELRTKEQLGYAVSVMFHQHSDMSFGIALVVGRHSDKLCPCYIDRRMDALLQTFYDRDLATHAAICATAFGMPFLTQNIAGFYRNTFLSGWWSGMRKLTIQVTGGWGQPMASAPCQSGQVTRLCKKSIWMTPLHTIGWQQGMIAVAKDPAEDDTLSMLDHITRKPYFIGDLNMYHGMRN